MSQNGMSNYTAEDIQILDEIEAVRLRPGMYIGGTSREGLQRLLYEIVYNSIDEAMAGFCDQIEVIIHNDNSITVIDNGRGIPTELMPTADITALEAVMTRLHAGAKFGGLVYNISSGLHGVGASVVNALSSWLRVEIRRQGKIYLQEYQRGIPTGEVQLIGDALDTGTTVTFLADKEIFEDINYDFNTTCQRLRELAFLNKGVQISINDEGADQGKTFYFEGGIASFVHRLNRNRAVIHHYPIYLSATVNSTIVEAALQYNDSFTESAFSFANCVNTRDGGSHLTGFRSALTHALNDYARKNKLIKDTEPNLIGDDVRQGLISIINIKLPEPQFEGQTKAKLGNPEVRSQVESAVADNLSLYLEQHPDEARAILEKCLTSAKAREAARKARDLILKRTGFEASTLPGKLADCSEKNPALCELFLVEGDSAGGSAKQGRDRRFQAILPLRGKILNVEKATQDKIIEHEELRAIATALRANIDGQGDLSKLRYQRIIIMTDADVDGSHIRTLLLTFFYRHMMELINQGYLFIAQPPLYRIKSGKQQFWIYSEQEKERKIKELGGNKQEIQRYKGLGEMSPEQLWSTTMNPTTRTLLQVRIEDAIAADQAFHMLMGNEVLPRKNFIQAHAQNVRNLDI
ncbi:MAG: DNA topoisomerase (ATP-hydrolyzing) subunit B [Chloroflexi bacterium CG07_land_8_20_14_0_80_45_17]|nr:MAG: DNA topoisomerase (ATP-hydrolyzing) subunit B [Chloroflexi bacterium CG23_combo_of_CG06-09_8_20_14_all_45_10]PIU56771.1 MAG: DNA topoisomerase (ATP-hydrolyzing) subunit B [Chloroflexi bacterium CG07_land_8_20_14_0_80_45_17]